MAHDATAVDTPAADSPGWLGPLSPSEALRRGLCMLPMLVVGPLGFGDYTVAVGQAAFFFGNQALPVRAGQRVLVGLLLVTLGLGFFLLGGNVAGYVWLAGLYTLLIGVAIGMLSNWSVLNVMAFSFVSLFTAGLNTGSS